MSTENKCHREFQEEIFDAHYDDLLLYANYHLRDTFLAKDAVQDTMVVALRRADEFIGHPNPVGFLYGVLRRIIKHMKSDLFRMRQHVISLEECPPDALQTSDEINVDLMYGDIVSTDEFEMLRKLYVHGYTYAQLGEEMGLTPDAIGMRVMRIRRKFKDKYRR